MFEVDDKIFTFSLDTHQYLELYVTYIIKLKCISHTSKNHQPYIYKNYNCMS